MNRLRNSFHAWWTRWELIPAPLFYPAALDSDKNEHDKPDYRKAVLPLGKCFTGCVLKRRPPVCAPPALRTSFRLDGVPCTGTGIFALIVKERVRLRSLSFRPPFPAVACFPPPPASRSRCCFRPWLRLAVLGTSGASPPLLSCGYLAADARRVRRASGGDGNKISHCEIKSRTNCHKIYFMKKYRIQIVATGSTGGAARGDRVNRAQKSPAILDTSGAYSEIFMKQR
jgi:hypothetical protein